MTYTASFDKNGSEDGGDPVTAAVDGLGGWPSFAALPAKAKALRKKSV